MDKKDLKKIDILRVLKEEAKPLTSTQITETLHAAGILYSERTVRMYLQILDDAGCTQSLGRRGRVITKEGLKELQSSEVVNRLGYLSAKIDRMTYRMTFDLPTCSGKVIINTSIVPCAEFVKSVDMISQVFRHGFGMGQLVSLIPSGETVGETTIPKDSIGFCTVCSLTLNGVMLKHGIPVASRFSGLLELREGKFTRFAEIINYDATTVDPLEIFTRAGMTNNTGAVQSGNGVVGAAFRELPGESRSRVESLTERMEKLGLGSFLKIGLPNQPILGIPVSEGRIGAIVLGGLNPIAILEESGRKILQSGAISGLLDFHKLFHYKDLLKRFREVA